MKISPLGIDSIEEFQKEDEKVPDLDVTSIRKGGFISPKETEAIIPVSREGVSIKEEDEKNALKVQDERSILAIALETTWLRVHIDNDQPFDITMKTGQSFTWKAIDQFKIIIGNAGGIELYYNGKPVGPLGKSGQVVSLTLPNERVQ